MASPWHKHPLLSFAEYQALEEAASPDARYEFMDGIVYAMSGGTVIHNRIIGNIAFSLRSRFGNNGGQVLTENVKLEVAPNTRYVYPDVMVSCSARDWQANLLVKDPVLVVEVLSESTERKDLIEKVDLYQSLSSLRAYLIVDQYSCWVRIYERSPDGSWAAHRHLNHREDVLSLTDPDWQMPLAEMYRNVPFDSKQ
ncbi:MAG TPA: Uma2 family endonuclease [Cytophagales bacterium]|jgi:Uma2 family endonuclease